MVERRAERQDAAGLVRGANSRASSACKVGDTVTVNVLGRDLTATIANLRQVEWRNLGINFVMVFSPGTFRGAPHSDLATLTLPGGTDAPAENRILRDVAEDVPVGHAACGSRTPSTRSATSSASWSWRSAGRARWPCWRACSCWPAPSRPVTGRGSTTPWCSRCWAPPAARLLTAYALEYGALGLVTALFGLAAGTLAGWVIVAKVMHLDFRLDLSGALLAAGAAVALAILLGLAGTWRILGQKPAPYLRQI